MEIETQAQAVKDANKSTRDARKERDYYKGLAGMYQLTYDDDTAVSDAVITLQGIYVELQSDLLQFKVKNGNSERVEKSQKRLSLMLDSIDILSKIQTSNIALKSHLRNLERRNHLQFTEISDLKRQLLLHTENL